MRVVYENYLNVRIDGILVDMKIIKSRMNELEDAVTLIEKSLQVNAPFPHLSGSLGLCNVVRIIAEVFPEMFLKSIENAKTLSIAQSGTFYLNAYLKAILGTEYLHIFSYPRYTSLSDKMYQIVLDGNDTTMNLNIRLKSNHFLHDLSASVGISALVRYIFRYYQSEFEDYIGRQAKEYTINRKVLYFNNLFVKLFGTFHSSNKNDYMLALNLIKNVVDKEYRHQCGYFVATNKETMQMSSDYWSLCYMRGGALNQVNFDFAGIKSYPMRQEIKAYFKHNLSSKKDLTSHNSQINMLTIAVNFLTDSNDIRHFAEIDNFDVNSLSNFLQLNIISQYDSNLSPITVRQILDLLSEITKFLMEDKITMKYPKPKHNYFRDITFYNLADMVKTTDIIPDEIMEQISLHIDELNPMFQRMFKIFDCTGCRLKEVVYLEQNCVSETSDELWFSSYKTIHARRKLSLSDKRMIIISDKVKNCIFEQIKDSKELRDLSGLPYIFLYKSASVIGLSRGGFNQAINKLIQKYDIRDLQGELWHFTSRQMRKTLVSTMIMNGANENEVIYQLGHFSSRTARKHYEDVEKKKLADLTSEFYKQQFEIKIGKERLEVFSEEERKALYVDFRLNYREVEFGHCTKRIGEGVCNKRSGKINCATCTKICTGKKYLPKWTSLLQSQQAIIKEFEQTYAKQGIERTVYCSFVEYKREVYLLNSYQDAINNILEG